MGSAPPSNLRLEIGLGAGLASERAASDLSVALVAYVHKLQHDLCEARRREALLVERIEQFEKRMQRVEKGMSEGKFVNTEQIESRLDRLEKLVDVMKHNEENVGCKNPQNATPLPKHRDTMATAMEMVTPAPVKAVPNLQAGHTRYECSSPEMMRCGQEVPSSQSDELKSIVPPRYDATPGKASDADGEVTSKDDLKRVDVNGNSAARTIAEATKKTTKNAKKSVVGDIPSRPAVKQEDVVQDVVVQNNGRKSEKAASGATRGVKRGSTSTRNDKLKRVKRSSSRKASLSSDGSKPGMASGANASCMQAVAQAPQAVRHDFGEEVTAGTNLEAVLEEALGDKLENVAREDDEVGKAKGDQLSTSEIEKVSNERVQAEENGKSPMVLEGLRTAGDAIRLVQERERRKEREQDDILKLAGRLRKIGGVAHCPECTQRFKNVASKAALLDATRMAEWLRKYCGHQQKLLTKRDTPDGYWDLSFDDTPTQPPDL